MRSIVVVDSKKDWTPDLENVEVVTGNTFIMSEEFRRSKPLKVINLCRSYRYPSVGYYVSLLASARGFKPHPAISTIQDLRSPAMVRLATGDLDSLIQESLAPIKRSTLDCDIFFGRTLDPRLSKLALRLVHLFHTPLMRVHFVKESKWVLTRITPLPPSEIPMKLRRSVSEAAQDYLRVARGPTPLRKKTTRFNLALMINPDDKTPPSNMQAIRRFIKAAEKRQMAATIITKDDFARIAEFDALFIREATATNNHTYRFARRAESLGLVVIDDPESSLRCSNKVFLRELMLNHGVPCPSAVIVNIDNLDEVARGMSTPVILRRPEGKLEVAPRPVSSHEFRDSATKMLADSELLIAEQQIDAEHQWRIGILDGKALYACKYHHASDSYQAEPLGRLECVPCDLAPKKLMALSVRAASLIGQGFYGVSVAQCGKDFYVTEISDSPPVDYDREDALLKDELYARVMDNFLKHITNRRQGR